MDLPPAWYVLADPGVHVPTAALFASPDLTRDAPVAKIEDFASGSLLGNAFEPVLRRHEPAVEAALVALSSIGRARLTGSGSGCFVEFTTRAAAEQALAELPEGLRAWVAAGVERSPLLDVLERY
jgi:4-diphosphocytidyl-2-C-methyl-D-erythritol kinase